MQKATRIEYGKKYKVKDLIQTTFQTLFDFPVVVTPEGQMIPILKARGRETGPMREVEITNSGYSFRLWIPQGVSVDLLRSNDAEFLIEKRDDGYQVFVTDPEPVDLTHEIKGIGGHAIWEIVKELAIHIGVEKTTAKLGISAAAGPVGVAATIIVNQLSSSSTASDDMLHSGRGRVRHNEPYTNKHNKVLYEEKSKL